MRGFARVLFVVLLFGLVAGPAFSAPLTVSAGPTIAAPASHGSPSSGGFLTWLAVPAVFGAIRIKDTGTLAKKFVQRAGQAGGDYKTGVEQSGADWETKTKAGAGNWADGVNQAIADKRFERGVSDAGAAKFVTRATTLGAQRYPTGVAAAEGDWAKGAQPYLDALKGMDLPLRRPKGDPANQQRANAVAMRLRAIKVGK